MAARKTPYGYRLSGGKIVISEDEAEIIQQIFTDKANGISGTQLANKLNNSNISYFCENSARASDRVYSILRDERYLGRDGYPQIVDEDVFNKARGSLVKSNRTPKTDAYTILKKLTVCSECGKNMVHFSCRTGKKQWRCTSKVCVNFKPSFTDKEFHKAIIGIISAVTDKPQKLDTGESLTEYTPTVEVMRIENEIARLKAVQPIDYDTIKRKILALAVAKYECCTYSRAPYLTAELQKVIELHGAMEGLDTEYLQRIIKHITVNGEKEISIEFINGKTITYERGNINDKDTTDGS